MLETLLKDIIPINDAKRLEALRRYDILFTPAEEIFDNITQMLAQVFRVPMSFISLVDEETVFYKSQVGPFGKSEVQRLDSLCSLTILGREPLVIEDASGEACFQGNPYVDVEGGIKFYAGAPLITRDGFQIGTACIIDTEKRTFSEEEKSLLMRFAKQVMHEIEMRHIALKQVELANDVQAKNKELQNLYQELQFVTDTMPQLVWATEPDGYSFFFNKGWLQYTGLSFDEVKGNGWTKSLHPDDSKLTFDAWRRAVENGGIYDVEYRLKRHDGVYRWFVARGVPMKDAAGKILKWYGTTTDIHDQKQTEEALKQSKERFDLVAKATQDAIWDWNLLSNDIWWSDGFKTLFGYKDEEIEPTIVSWYNRVHPDDKDRVVGGIHRVIDNGGSQWSDEYRFRKKDGSYAIVFDRGYALQNKEGKPYRMLGSMQDITARKQYEVTLTQSEAQFRTLANAIFQLSWMADANGWIHWYNDRWFEYTGTTMEEMKGWGWEKVHHPDHIHRVVSFVKEAWQKEEPWELTFPLRRHDGTYRWFLTRSVPVRDNEGKVIQWIGTNTDIDAQKQVEVLLEERVRERTRELELRNRELEQFTYVSHHDLQEPLRKILIFSDMVKSEAEEKLSEASLMRLEKVSEAGRRMSIALRDVLNFASLNKEENLSTVDLNETLASVISDLELVINEKNAKVSVASLPVINAIPQQMHQLFYNLVNNALKFSKPGEISLVSVSCSQKSAEEIRVVHNDLEAANSYYQITVQDNGIGFEQKFAFKIFGMFQRLHSKNDYAGTGIGLALVKKVVANHGGKIWAEGIAGNGAVFHVLLPVKL